MSKNIDWAQWQSLLSDSSLCTTTIKRNTWHSCVLQRGAIYILSSICRVLFLLYECCREETSSSQLKLRSGTNAARLWASLMNAAALMSVPSLLETSFWGRTNIPMSLLATDKNGTESKIENLNFWLMTASKAHQRSDTDKQKGTKKKKRSGF